MTDLSGNYEYDCQVELNRKTFEALELIERQYNSGRMSPAAYRGALEGINACVRGLVPEQYVLAIDQEVSLLPDKDKRVSLWASTDQVYLLSMTVGEDFFVVRTVPAGAGKKIIRGEDTDSVTDAVRKFNKFEQKLKAHGYKQL
jgi:hypothetical protein